MPKLSIIIPCYNAEKHIDRCFSSLEGQTIGIEQLEIIFVNDASTDNTLKCLTDFEKKHPENVIVINCEKNGRQGAARNIGLRHATAEYVGFADDDDAFEPEMFEDLYEKAKAYDCDMVMCEFNNITDTEYNNNKDTDLSGNNTSRNDAFYVITTPEERLAIITSDPVRCIWNKIYRRIIISENNISFPEGYIYDDIYFYELVKHYVNRLYVCDRIYYHHIFHETSASIDPSRKDDMQGYLNVQIMLLEELKRRNLYHPYSMSYNEMLLLEAIGLVKSYLMRYGEIEYSILNTIKDKLSPYKDEFLSNPLLEPIWQTEEENTDKKIAQILVS